MTFSLPELPYAKEALEPHMSRETLEYHYGKHHKTYVDTANKLVAGTEFEKMSLEEVIAKSSGKIFNNCAQIWNHSFFWQCLSPKSAAPGKKLADALVKSFGGLDDFKKKFTETALGTFGSGWTWLVKNSDGSLGIVSTQGAGNPLTDHKKPLLTCDVWEHAYYIDYRNARPTYLEHYWALVNWEFVEGNLG
jgi:Fe-Mn family superoxide dismutase